MVVNMKTALKKIVLVCLCLSMLLVLFACDSGEVGTKLTLDRNCSGTRVMSFTLKQSDISSVDVFGWFTPKVSSVTSVLQGNCPDELTMDVAENGTDATYYFTLAFSSLDEYRTKVAALRGKAASIEFSVPDDELFVSGLTIKEDFTSSELFGWAVKALSAAYPKYADKIDFTATDGNASVVFGGRTFTSGAKISIEPVSTPLERILISTVRNGEDDYNRSYSFSITADNLELIGAEDFKEQFIKPMLDGIDNLVTYDWGESTDDIYTYNVTLIGADQETLNLVTSSIFPGSTIEYKKLDGDAFSESSCLIDSIPLTGFPCNEDGTSNLTLVYKAGDNTVFSSDSLASGVLSIDSGETAVTVRFDSASSARAEIVSETRYAIDKFEVASEMNYSGNLTLSVVLSYPSENGRSGSQRALERLTKQFADTGIKVSVRTTAASGAVAGTGEEADVTRSADAETAETEPANVDYALVLSCSGTPERVSEIMTSTFGEGNSFSIRTAGDRSVYRSSTVEHSVDLTALKTMSAYEGNIIYRFTTTLATISDVNWSTESGAGSADVLHGEKQKNTFYIPDVSASRFAVKYTYKQLNIPFIVIVLLLTFLAIGVVMWLLSFLSRRSIKSRRRKKEDVALVAVKTVALANVPEELRGGISTLPPELTRRPTVVLEPRTDDGLDDETDEPEGVVMFASTLKILVITSIVLFFFPFFKVSKTVAVNISGWDNFFGKTLFNASLEPDRWTILLLIVPALLLILLMARRILPRIVIPAVLTGGSLACVYVLRRLPDSLAERIDDLRSVLTGAYITDPVNQMAYSYSIVIYVLLAAGGIMLLFTDLAFIFSRKRREDSLS